MVAGPLAKLPHLSKFALILTASRSTVGAEMRPPISGGLYWHDHTAAGRLSASSKSHDWRSDVIPEPRSAPHATGVIHCCRNRLTDRGLLKARDTRHQLDPQVS
jgi:hypothetical protein